MATLKKLSNIFYKVSKILLIVGIIAYAVATVVEIIVGIVGLIGALQLTGDEQTAAMVAAISALVVLPIVFVVLMVLSIIALSLVKKAVGNEAVKSHILAAIFGALSGAGMFSIAACIVSVVYINRGGKFGDEVVEAKAVEAKPEAKEEK